MPSMKDPCYSMPQTNNKQKTKGQRKTNMNPITDGEGKTTVRRELTCQAYMVR